MGQRPVVARSADGDADADVDHRKGLVSSRPDSILMIANRSQLDV